MGLTGWDLGGLDQKCDRVIMEGCGSERGDASMIDESVMMMQNSLLRAVPVLDSRYVQLCSSLSHSRVGEAPNAVPSRPRVPVRDETLLLVIWLSSAIGRLWFARVPRRISDPRLRHQKPTLAVRIAYIAYGGGLFFSFFFCLCGWS